jgi:hypothetical protein
MECEIIFQNQTRFKFCYRSLFIKTPYVQTEHNQKLIGDGEYRNRKHE